jgi:hypothetical protein
MSIEVGDVRAPNHPVSNEHVDIYSPTTHEKYTAALEHRQILEERLGVLPRGSREHIETARNYQEVSDVIELHKTEHWSVRALPGSAQSAIFKNDTVRQVMLVLCADWLMLFGSFAGRT